MGTGRTGIEELAIPSPPDLYSQPGVFYTDAFLCVGSVWIGTERWRPYPSSDRPTPVAGTQSSAPGSSAVRRQPIPIGLRAVATVPTVPVVRAASFGPSPVRSRIGLGPRSVSDPRSGSGLGSDSAPRSRSGPVIRLRRGRRVGPARAGDRSAAGPRSPPGTPGPHPSSRRHAPRQCHDPINTRKLVRRRRRTPVPGRVPVDPGPDAGPCPAAPRASSGGVAARLEPTARLEPPGARSRRDPTQDDHHDGIANRH